MNDKTIYYLPATKKLRVNYLMWSQKSLNLANSSWKEAKTLVQLMSEHPCVKSAIVTDNFYGAIAVFTKKTFGTT